jgi:predicted DNA-binding transcriptional regulator YafY
MNRIDRISAILIHLQSKQVVKASEMANRFGVSKRTIYRDIRSLEEAGVPIGGEAGVGYYLADNYHLPPVSLTREEAGSFILAAKLMEKHSDFGINQQFQSGLTKIRAVLRNSDKSYLENIEGQIAVLKAADSSNTSKPTPYLSIIMQAMSEKKVIKLSYFSAYRNEQTLRLVEPYNIWFYSMNWHLIGYCRMRKSYRDFRIDRIQQVRISDRNFEKPLHISIEHYFAEIVRKGELFSVRLIMTNEVYAFIQNTRYYFGFVSEEKLDENRYQMDFLVSDLQYLAKWIITLGNHVEILFPKALKEIVLAEVEVLSEHYGV